MQYKVRSGDSLSRIAKKYKITLNALLAENPRFKANPNQLRVGDKLAIPKHAKAYKKPAKPAKVSNAPATGTHGVELPKGKFKVPFGQITFDAEGMEGGRYHSRKLHVPGSSSGATIGRGYDMKERSEDGIYEDLINAGIPKKKARDLSQLSGFKGKKAKNAIRDLGLENLEITPIQQRQLFILTYQELEGDVIRICSKHDVVAKYGATDWDNLHPIMRDIVVDLRYRGDYTPGTRQKVQPCLVENSMGSLQDLISDRHYWVTRRSVPNDRFKRRKNYLVES